jgi:hypothetical protein
VEAEGEMPRKEAVEVEEEAVEWLRMLPTRYLQVIIP